MAGNPGGGTTPVQRQAAARCPRGMQAVRRAQEAVPQGERAVRQAARQVKMSGAPVEPQHERSTLMLTVNSVAPASSKLRAVSRVCQGGKQGQPT